MNRTLNSIFKTEGSSALTVSDQIFSNEDIFEEFIDSSIFNQTK